MTDPLDASQSEPRYGGPSFSLGNRIERGAWHVCWLVLGRVAPPPLGWAWRRMLLRMFGAQIGKQSRVYPSAKIWLPRNLRLASHATIGPGVQCYNMEQVSLGPHALVSQRAFLCAGDHDHRDPDFQLVVAPITLEANCWIAAEAFVGPGSTIGEGAVLAARGVAIADLPAWTVWGGNPARQIAQRPKPEQPTP